MDDEELADMLPRLLYVGFRVAEKMRFFPPRVIVRPRRFSTLSSAPVRVHVHVLYFTGRPTRAINYVCAQLAIVKTRTFHDGACTRPMIYDNGSDDDDDDAA